MKIALIAIGIVAIAALALMWLIAGIRKWDDEMMDNIMGPPDRHDYKQTERDVEW